MPWTERQQALLRALGHRVWAPPATAPEARATIARSDVAAAPAPVQPAPEPEPAAAARSTALRQELPAELAPELPRDARAATIATLDWAPLRETVAACVACGLCRQRRQTVFGVGGSHARWMVVGEAPGEQEDRQGEPFVGPAGQLLDRMLAALGLTRAADAEPSQQVYIANTLKCRPPGNRNPAPEELAACEPFLQRQLALVQPRIVLAMGRFAVQALLRSNEAIGKLRGRVHTYQGVPLVVTYHPAYLLRSPHDKARTWQDLCLAAATADASARGDGADGAVSAAPSAP
ncbi:MAG: uracil-DNA glycosylase [Rubrivivax sp.]